MDGSSTMLTSNEVFVRNQPPKIGGTITRFIGKPQTPNVITSIVVKNIQVDFLCSVVSFFPFLYMTCTWVSCTNYTLELVCVACL